MSLICPKKKKLLGWASAWTVLVEKLPPLGKKKKMLIHSENGV